jgi:hypothetical protein
MRIHKSSYLLVFLLKLSLILSKVRLIFLIWVYKIKITFIYLIMIIFKISLIIALLISFAK